jgi:site-specific DNA-adenine methylase
VIQHFIGGGACAIVEELFTDGRHPQMLGKFQIIRDAKEYLCQEAERLEYCKLVVEAIDALKPAVAMGIDSKSDNDMIAKQLAERRLADELRQQEREHFESSVLRQMHVRRKAAESRARARKQTESSSSGCSSSSSDGEQKEECLMRKAAAGKKKGRML